jgi:hypothetical protein
MGENNGALADVAAAAGYGAGRGGFGGFGGDGAWFLIILFLFALMGGNGWGNRGGFGGGGDLYPWINNSQNINDGFRDQMMTSQVMGVQNAITSGFGDVQTALCGGFAGVTAAVNGAQNGITMQMMNNQMADMNRSFALQQQLAQCCCDNRAATADLKYTVAAEACATRQANADNTQKILDQLCQDKLDAKNDIIAQLRQELMFSRGQSSQDVQTAAIQAGQRALANEIEQYVLPTPRPAYIVANPNCCNNGCGYNNGCGCN